MNWTLCNGFSAVCGAGRQKETWKKKKLGELQVGIDANQDNITWNLLCLQCDHHILGSWTWSLRALCKLELWSSTWRYQAPFENLCMKEENTSEVGAGDMVMSHCRWHNVGTCSAKPKRLCCTQTMGTLPHQTVLNIQFFTSGRAYYQIPGNAQEPPQVWISSKLYPD